MASCADLDHALVQELHELRRAQPEATVERVLAESVIGAKCDRWYWQAARAVLHAALARDPRELALTDDERLTLDTGLLDDRLVERPAALASALRAERAQEGTDADLYLSGFLARRYAEYLLTAAGEDAPAAGDGALPAELPAALAKLRRDRGLLLPRLEPLLVHLPGVSAKVIALLTGGGLDAQIDQLTYAVGTGAADGAARAQLAQFCGIRTRLFEQMRDAARGRREALVLLEALARLGAKIEDELRAGAARPVARAAPGAGGLPAAGPRSLDARREFLDGELKLLRSLLRLLSGDAKVRRGHCTLLRDEPRVTRPVLAAIRRRVADVDPLFPGAPLALLVPYAGTGKFEWDRNTLLVSLTPDGAPEEGMVHALANYRVMIDTLQAQGELRRAYETQVSAGDFRNGFVRDYQRWVLGVGAGFRGALEPPSFAFFTRHIGPRSDGPLGPRALIELAPDQHGRAIAEARRRLEADPHDAEARRRLGVIAWLRGHRNEALTQFEQALPHDAGNPELLYAVGILRRQLGSRDWKDPLRGAMQHGARSLWQVYAGEALGM